jgi:deoxyhypusine monooxygenase
MVRHEAAEALGGIASDGAPTEGQEEVDVLAILREWAVKEDAPVVVRESCQVAIDMWEVSHIPFPGSHDHLSRGLV